MIGIFVKWHRRGHQGGIVAWFTVALLWPVAAATSVLPAQTPRQAPEIAAADSRFTVVDRLIAKEIEEQHIAGAVAVVSQGGRVVYRNTQGWRDRDREDPMTSDTLFRIASMTKPLTSVAVMMLVEDGRLELKDPLETHLPEFHSPRVLAADDSSDPTQPAARSITIEDLLTHQSGLTYRFFGQPSYLKHANDARFCEGLSDSDLTLAESTRALAALPLIRQPGSGWQYGMSTDVLGRVVEVVSGQPFDAFVFTNILRPLGMNDTHFVVPEEKRLRLSRLYRPRDDKTIEAVDAGVHTAAGLTYSATFQNPGHSQYRSGGAGLASTVDDYLRFLSFLLRGGELDGVRLLKRETVDRMTKNQIGDSVIAFPIHGDKFGYGFGVHTVDSAQPLGASPGTYSWGGIFQTHFWVDPKTEVIGILMTQLFPNDHLSLRADFQSRVYECLEQTIEVGAAPGPRPGDVYREYAIHNGGNLDWRVTDPRATANGAWQFLPNPKLKLEVTDLRHAVRAEAVIDRWGGHLRTTNKRIRFNDHPWLRVGELETTPKGRAEYYYSQDNPVIPIPLDHLHEGTNLLEGTCSTRDGYNWGQWGLYSLILRVYYDPDLVRSGSFKISEPTSDSVITGDPTVRVTADSTASQVDILARYDGEDEDGDGRYFDWHGANIQLVRGEEAALFGHVGTDHEPPFDIQWDTEWVPEQKHGSIEIVARMKNDEGLWTVSQPVTGLTLRRTGARVAIIHAVDVPERFGVRTGRQAECKLVIPDSITLEKVTEARLSLRTWHGWDEHHHPLTLNDQSFPINGNNHHFDIDRLPIPVTALKPGPNRLIIRSDTDHHMLEVLWPGPSLLLKYQR